MDGTLLTILGKGILLNAPQRATAVTPAATNAAKAVKTVLSHISSTATDGSVRTVTTYSDGTSATAISDGDAIDIGGALSAG